MVLDLNKNTTLQYRSPEMVEPMLGWAVGLPSGALRAYLASCVLICQRRMGAWSAPIQHPSRSMAP
jgi:hypothetical protein